MKKVYLISFVFVLTLVYFLYPSPKEESSSHVLSVAWEASPRTYDPRYAVDANSQYLEGLLHCSLLASNRKGNLEPQLAKSLEWKNGKQLVVELRSGFTFSDGKPVRPVDVKKTYEFFLRTNNERPSPRAVAFRKLKEIKIINGKLHFFLKETDASFTSNLVVGVLPEEDSWGSLQTRDSKIKGCGPFVHKSSTLNEITLERRDSSYFKKNDGEISELKIKIVKDPSTRFAKLRKGELDIVQNTIDYQKLSSINSYNDLKVVQSPALRTSYLGFNLRHPLLKQLKVRQAIAYAIDKESMISYVLKGFATEAKTMLPEGHSYYKKPQKEYSYNVKRANELLDEAGYPVKGSHRFHLTLTITNNSTRFALAKVLANNLKDIGIQLRIRTVEWGKFKQDIEKGLVDAWLLAWIGYKDPDIYRYAFASESFPPNGGNRGWYSNKDLDKLLAKGLVSYKEAERKKVYSEVSSLVGEDLPYIFLFHENNFAVLRKNVKDFQIYADGHYTSIRHVKKL